MSLSRLDLLIYSHDGRGLGHASRSIAIGVAMRRLYPKLKVLFVSGCAFSQELINKQPLDWLKLPSYQTQVIEGKSRGIDGKSNFSDAELGQVRAQHLRDMITLYQPKCILADHSPQGKHKELVPALVVSQAYGCKWVLGMRGITGEVSQTKSELARELFAKHYSALLWYGDSQVLTTGQLEQLTSRFGMKPVETGYVSRFKEVHQDITTRAEKKKYGLIVAIPWTNEYSTGLLETLAQTLATFGSDFGKWNFFIPLTGGSPRWQNCIKRLHANTSCHLHSPGPTYAKILTQSKAALIYGGYNSLTDVLFTRTPTVVVLRDMQDREQQQHLHQLMEHTDGLLTPFAEESIDSVQLTDAISSHLNDKAQPELSMNLAGGENTARCIASLL